MDNIHEIIKKIVDIEWDMFTSVNEGEERADCQNDRRTFEAMRVAQFTAWSREAAGYYLCDLEAARQAGRNLVEEKYIHMMRTTEPRQYGVLLTRVTTPEDAARSIAQEISDILLSQTRDLFEDYPYMSGQGRPLYSIQDFEGISVETYQHSELLTYSEKTLAALKRHISALENEGRFIAREILENTIMSYGYDSLEAAEAAVAENSGQII